MLGADVDGAAVHRPRGALRAGLDNVQIGLVAQPTGAVEHDVLVEVATARDVEHLMAAADAHVGDTHCEHAGHQRKVGVVALGVDAAAQAAWSLAVEARVDVVIGAGEHEAVGQRQLALGGARR